MTVVSGEQPLALIIEDDAYLAIIFSKALQRAEFRTEVVDDGISATERLREVVPAVVVLDLHLPHVSGDKLLRQIRSDERLAQTRVILATADAHLADTLREESDLVLLKPIGFGQLSDLAARFHPLNTPSSRR